MLIWLPFFLFSSTISLFFLLWAIIIIIVIIILIIILSNIHIPFFYHTTNTVYDIPIIKTNKIIEKRYLNKPTSYYQILTKELWNINLNTNNYNR